MTINDQLKCPLKGLIRPHRVVVKSDDSNSRIKFRTNFSSEHLFCSRIKSDTTVFNSTQQNTTMSLPVFPENKTQLLETYRGALGNDLSSVNIALSAAILLQNYLVISFYWSQRANFSASMYIAIAIADMGVAQGAIVVSVAGIAVTSDKWNIRVLYYCFYYFMATSGLAINCSKYYNVVLSTVTTMKLKNPFRMMNFRRIQLSVVFLSIVLSFLCLSDCSAGLFQEISGNFLHLRDYHKFFGCFIHFPGAATAYTLLCEGLDSQFCYPGHYVNTAIQAAFAVFMVFVNLILPPLIFLVSGLWLIVLFRRAVRQHDISSNLHSTVVHISVTVFLIASLSFVCNTALAVITLIVCDQQEGDRFTYFEKGRIVGFTSLTLPLINAALFTAILISRSSSLQKKIFSPLKLILSYPNMLFEKLRRSYFRRNDDETSFPYLLNDENEI